MQNCLILWHLKTFNFSKVKFFLVSSKFLKTMLRKDWKEFNSIQSRKKKLLEIEFLEMPRRKANLHVSLQLHFIQVDFSRVSSFFFLVNLWLSLSSYNFSTTQVHFDHLFMALDSSTIFHYVLRSRELISNQDSLNCHFASLFFCSLLRQLSMNVDNNLFYLILKFCWHY